jgi:hypothetical protein
MSSTPRPRLEREPLPNTESTISGVSWPAVLAGAFVTAAMSFTMMALGAGMGLSSMSPWPQGGLSASRAAPIAIIWLILVELLACSLGGYVAGRLRTKWVAVHNHEVFFRDTAHGLLVWAVGLVVAVAFLSSLSSSIAKDLSNVSNQTETKFGDYYVDSLLRGAPVADANDQAVRAQVRTILVQGLAAPQMDAGDKAYLATLVSSRTGISEADASGRVEQVLGAERQQVDRARKSIAHSLYWLVVALLIGAFAGSYAAVIGGRRRDYVWS